MKSHALFRDKHPNSSLPFPSRPSSIARAALNTPHRHHHYLPLFAAAAAKYCSLLLLLLFTSAADPEKNVLKQRALTAHLPQNPVTGNVQLH